MPRFIMLNRKLISFIVVLAFCNRMAVPAIAESPVKMKNFQGTIEFGADGITAFTLKGSAAHLGEFTCEGEVAFEPADDG